MADAGRSAGKHDIAGLERHALRDVGDCFRDREHHVVGVVRLHDLPIEAALDLQALGAGGHLIGRNHPGPKAPGAVEILAHVPLRCFALKLAHRAFVAAGISGDASICIGRRQVLGPLADDENELSLVIERLRCLGPQDGLPVRDERAAPAHEDGGEFRNVVALGAFLDVFEIIEPEADHFPRCSHRQAIREPFEGAASGRRGTFRRVLKGR